MIQNRWLTCSRPGSILAIPFYTGLKRRAKTAEQLKEKKEKRKYKSKMKNRQISKRVNIRYNRKRRYPIDLGLKNS